MEIPHEETFGDYFNTLDPIDEDAQGGYARVAEVEALFLRTGAKAAFKVMRTKDMTGTPLSPETWEKRFLAEFRILNAFAQEEDVPAIFTPLLGSGYVRRDILEALEEYEVPYDVPVYFTGRDEQSFIETHERLEKKFPKRFLPFLVVELAPYRDSLFRQIRRRRWHGESRPRGVAPRLPVGEALQLSYQLLEGLRWFHTHIGRIYLDWKTEHIYWSAWRLGVHTALEAKGDWMRPLQGRLIDYNVTGELKDAPDREAALREELRLFCGAVLYPALTLYDPESDGKPLGGKPTRVPERGSQDAHLRYRVKGTLTFYEGADERLDKPLKEILRTGLENGGGYTSVEALQAALSEYARRYLDLEFRNPLKPGASSFLHPRGISGQNYLRALRDLRLGQNLILRARRGLVEALRKSSGESGEYEALVRTIDHVLEHSFLP